MRKHRKKNRLDTPFPEYPRSYVLVAVFFIAVVVLLFESLDFPGSHAQVYNTPTNPLVQKMKRRGCVFDGLLTGFGEDFDSKIKLLKRSNCYLLHRSVETWNKPPDFDNINKKIAKLDKEIAQEFMYSLFIAESINIGSEYTYQDENRNFRFNEMCSPGTLGDWGPGTCKPSLNSPEYRKYVSQITRQAIDLGIRDIVFGQVYYQDDSWQKKPVMGEVVSEIKEYAQSQSKEIVIGAQTNDIDDERYLRIFDYITGGIGQDENGNIEEATCSSRFEGFCWALLWDKKYKSKANNILVYLDWNVHHNDDMNRFVRMPKEDRRAFLRKSYDYFTQKDIGFLMPMLAVLDGSKNGCYGDEPEFYSASKEFKCKDEATINDILGRAPAVKYDADLVGQSVPAAMVAGKSYPIEITFRNTGAINWTDEVGVQLDMVEMPTGWDYRPIVLASQDIILVSSSKTFRFEISVPSQPGKYQLQWRLRKGQQEWFGRPSDTVDVDVVAQPQKPHQAINGPVCVDKQLVKCNKLCTQPGAWCNAATGEAYCAGAWYDDKSYRKAVACCEDDDCGVGMKCLENKCVQGMVNR